MTHKFQTEFELDGAVYTAKLEREECSKDYDVSGFRDILIVRLDGEDVTWKGFGTPPIPSDIQVGDALLHSHMSKIAKVYVERTTKMRVMAGGRRYLRNEGREVGEQKWATRSHRLVGYNRDFLASLKARELLAKHKRDARRKALTSQIVDACRTADLKKMEHALRELG